MSPSELKRFFLLRALKQKPSSFNFFRLTIGVVVCLFLVLVPVLLLVFTSFSFGPPGCFSLELPTSGSCAIPGRSREKRRLARRKPSNRRNVFLLLVSWWRRSR